MTTSTAELVQLGDLDGLTVAVDRLAGREDWDGLVDLRDRCLQALEDTGRQLFGPAQYAAYRIALDGPAELAVALLEPGAAPFALGPLTEVVAQHHTWSQLAPHLDATGHVAVAAAVAQERVIRGEDLRGDGRAHPEEIDLPLVLQPWEPRYALPTYRADEVLQPAPSRPSTDADLGATAPGRLTSQSRPSDVAVALADLAASWEQSSTGEVHVASVDGTAEQAVAAVLPGGAGLAVIDLPTAFAWMAWAGATGGVHGRRRGLASGRAAAWWVGHVAAGVPLGSDPDELEFSLEELRWLTFNPEDATGGWLLQIAIEDPHGGWAVALDARDRDPAEDE